MSRVRFPSKIILPKGDRLIKNRLSDYPIEKKGTPGYTIALKERSPYGYIYTRRSIHDDG